MCFHQDGNSTYLAQTWVRTHTLLISKLHCFKGHHSYPLSHRVSVFIRCYECPSHLSLHNGMHGCSCLLGIDVLILADILKSILYVVFCGTICKNLSSSIFLFYAEKTLYKVLEVLSVIQWQCDGLQIMGRGVKPEMCDDTASHFSQPDLTFGECQQESDSFPHP